MPVASHSRGYIEIGVKPGSCSSRSPGRRRRLAGRNRPAPSPRTGMPRTRAPPARCTSAVCSARERCGHAVARPCRLRTCRRSRRSRPPGTTSPGTDASGGSSPSTPTSISRPSDRLLGEDPLVELSACAIASSSSARVRAFDTPTDDPMFAGLTKHGNPSSPSTAIDELVDFVPVAEREVRAAVRQARGRERPLHHDLVHRTADPNTPAPTYGNPCAAPTSSPPDPQRLHLHAGLAEP